MAFIPTISLTLTIIFLLIVLSYYVLLFIPRKKEKPVKKFNSISIIIPAHNEEKYIKDSVQSVIDADFKGTKQIIIVDDGSIDKTNKIISKIKYIDLKIIKTKHSGKSASINKALNIATGEIIGIVDGDSEIHKNALIELTKEISKENVAAATCVVKVKNKNKWICMWYHIEQLYNSLSRSIMSKVNANITTPGPLSLYRKKELKQIGGFSTEGFAEDVDVTIRLIRKGYRVNFCETAVSETNMPYDLKGIIRQRTRFARGIVNVIKRHMKFNNTIIDLYTLPLLLFVYIQSVIMGSITIYSIVSGYREYFLAHGIYFNFAVFKFLFGWFSLYGFFEWTYNVFAGIAPLNALSIITIISSLLSYPLYFYAIIKFDRKFDIYNIIAILFMAPFWLIIMVIYIICLPEVFMKKQYNIWKKNE